MFINNAILESVTCGDTQISAGDLHRHTEHVTSGPTENFINESV